MGSNSVSALRRSGDKQNEPLVSHPLGQAPGPFGSGVGASSLGTWERMAAIPASRVERADIEENGKRDRCRPLIIACRAVAPDHAVLFCLTSYIAETLLFPVPAEVVSHSRGVMKAPSMPSVFHVDCRLP